MRLEDKLYAYAGKKSGKVYTILSESPALAKVNLMSYLRYEPNQETGGYIHRTLKEIEELLPKFDLKTFKVVPDDGKEKP